MTSTGFPCIYSDYGPLVSFCVAYTCQIVEQAEACSPSLHSFITRWPARRAAAAAAAAVGCHIAIRACHFGQCRCCTIMPPHRHHSKLMRVAATQAPRIPAEYGTQGHRSRSRSQSSRKTVEREQATTPAHGSKKTAAGVRSRARGSCAH